MEWSSSYHYDGFENKDSFCSLHLGHRIFGALPILCIVVFKGREKWTSLYEIENTELFLKTISKSFTPDIKSENVESLKEVWPRNEFESFVIFSTIRLKSEINFFIREFMEVFHFPRTSLLWEKISKNISNHQQWSL